VSNERKFSLMNLIKTKPRSRLEEAHLNVCVRVSSAAREGITYKEFDFKKALGLWLASKERRNVSQ
jgi:hypothetical protein